MNKIALIALITLITIFNGACANSASKSSEMVSPGKTAYYIDSVKGSDVNSGLSSTEAWKSFSNINRTTLNAGDKVNIIAGGSFDQTLILSGTATAKSPVEVTFAPGRYDFYPTAATRKKFNISNTNGSPEDPKAMGIYLFNAKHFKVSGAGANIVCRGKMIEVCIDNSEDITIKDLSFDYHRPTVSEFKVVDVGDGFVDLKIHKDSWYEVKDGKIVWKGEGWSHGDADGLLAQELDPETNEVWRKRNPLTKYTFEEIKPGLIRARGKGGIRPAVIYQIRKTFRDCCGVFTRRSKDITWKNVHFNFMHGMGLVNQFSENLTFDKVTIAPDKESGRTTAAWADCIQASGCRGKVLVKDCVFSGAHDDAINIHGTYLRVTEKIGTHQVKVGFIHKQTYGFMAFNAGDEITFVRWDSLATYGPNKVKEAKMLNPKEILLTLENPYPSNINEKDVIENVTWTPEVEIRGCDVLRIPTRGFLITTQRKVVVENNRFHRTHMSALLIEGDASGWFESGCVRDMTIRDNKFIKCAEPVIKINPRNSVANNSVQQNIRILNNEFILRSKTMLWAKSTKGLRLSGNKVYAETLINNETAIKTNNCADVIINGNTYSLIGE